jgi:peptide/nickel transport system substrate-binding protein
VAAIHSTVTLRTLGLFTLYFIHDTDSAIIDFGRQNRPSSAAKRLAIGTLEIREEVMKQLSRRRFVSGAAALSTLPLIWPHTARAQAASVLKYRVFTDMQVLDPPFRLTAPEGDVITAIFPKLVSFEPGDSWKWRPDAAEEIEQVDDTHIRFKLRRGLKWTNGFGEVTAEDVKYSFERVTDPKLQAPYKDDWSALDHVEVTDPYSGVIVLKEYFAPLWWSTLPWNTASIICKKATEAAGGRFTTQPPATCGPYMWKEWQPKQRLILQRDPNWTGEQGAYDEIHVIPIEDDKTAEIAIQAGDLDMTRASLSSLATIRTQPPKGLKVLEKPSLAYWWVGMNTENAALSDEKVRKAIQKAIDVDMIIDAAFFGIPKRSTGIIAPGLLGHRDITPPARDLEGAKALFAEAGSAAPKNLTLSILNTTENKSAAQIVQQNLADLGIEVAINPYDGGTFWTLGDQKSGQAWKDLQLIINYFTMAPDPSWATAWFTCDQVGVWNWERWCNKEFSDLHKALLAERDDAKRDVGYKHMQDLMEGSGAYVFITHGVNAALYSDKIAPATLPDGRVVLQLFKPA